MPNGQLLPAIINPDDIIAGKNEYRVITRVKNNLLLSAIEIAGYTSVSAFAAAANVSNISLLNIINFKEPPTDRHGDWRPIVHRICDMLKKMPRQLFTETQMRLRDAKPKINEVSEAEAFLALENSSDSNPQSFLETKEMHAALGTVLEKLTPRYKEVIKLYYGLEEAPISFSEIGKRLNITGGRVAKMHQIALARLKRRDTITMLEAVKTI